MNDKKSASTISDAVGCLIIIAMLIGVIVFTVWSTSDQQIKANIYKFLWTQKVEIEEYSWYPDSNTTGFPQGSRNQSKTYTPKTTFDITYFGHFRPGIETNYHFEILGWHHTRTVSSNGFGRSPYYGEVVLSVDPEERESGRSGQYTVQFIDQDEKIYSFGTSYDQWISLNPNFQYSLYINNSTGWVTKIEPIR